MLSGDSTARDVCARRSFLPGTFFARGRSCVGRFVKMLLAWGRFLSEEDLAWDVL